MEHLQFLGHMQSLANPWGEGGSCPHSFIRDYQMPYDNRYATQLRPGPVRAISGSGYIVDVRAYAVPGCARVLHRNIRPAAIAIIVSRHHACVIVTLQPYRNKLKKKRNRLVDWTSPSFRPDSMGESTHYNLVSYWRPPSTCQ